MSVFELKLGEQRLALNTSILTVRKVRELAESLTEVRKKYLLTTKYPMEDKETVEEWGDRISIVITEEEKRKEGESMDAWVSRRLKPDLEAVEALKDQLSAIAGVFEQGRKVTPENFEDMVYPDAKEFVKKLLESVDLN
jgi:hypothetical protein